jgi:hypothetical protein
MPTIRQRSTRPARAWSNRADTKLNGLKNKIVSAHKANDAVEVIRLWDEADRVYRALTKRGIRPLRKEMDKSHRWAINQLKRKDDAG